MLLVQERFMRYETISIVTEKRKYSYCIDSPFSPSWNWDECGGRVGGYTVALGGPKKEKSLRPSFAGIGSDW